MSDQEQTIQDSPLLQQDVASEQSQDTADTQSSMMSPYNSGTGYYVPDYSQNSWDTAFSIGKPQVAPSAFAQTPSNQFNAGDYTSNTMSVDSTGGGNVAGAVGNGVGALAGAYNGASTDSGSSVLSGAASGAAAGAAFGPWGMAIGAVVGGIAGFFGSKSKKKQAKKAFENQMELQTAPERQAQANYLQKEGLLQTAMGNYKGIQPYKQTNALLGGHQYTPNLPSNPTQPNFNVAPPDIAHGKTNTTSPPMATVNGQVPGGLVAPSQPSYTGHQGTDTAAINQYAQNYQNYINNGNTALRDSILNNYSGIQG